MRILCQPSEYLVPDFSRSMTNLCLWFKDGWSGRTESCDRRHSEWLQLMVTVECLMGIDQLTRMHDLFTRILQSKMTQRRTGISGLFTLRVIRFL